MRNRRSFIRQGAFASAALLVAKPFLSFAQSDDFFSSVKTTGNSLTLLHTNDLHNHLKPHSQGAYLNMGGFDQTADLISRIKSTDANVVLLDAGDIFCGNTSHQDEHSTTLKMMQALGYDAALLGNRDYEAGPDYLQQQWQKNKTSLISSNYAYRDGNLKNLHQPYKIVQKGNIKIGIIAAGIELKPLMPARLSGLVSYTDPVAKLSVIASMLKKEKNCQLVICMSHLGYRNKETMDDVKLAAQSTDIDIIVGGHSHTFMQAPQIMLNKHQQEVIINHAGFGGMALGQMNISFDDYGNKNQLIFTNQLVGASENNWNKKRNEAAALS